MKKYYLDKVLTRTDTSDFDYDPETDCLVYEIDSHEPEELKAINDRIEHWNGYSFNHGTITITTYISEITAEEAKNYRIFKASDIFPELAQDRATAAHSKEVV